MHKNTPRWAIDSVQINERTATDHKRMLHNEGENWSFPTIANGRRRRVIKTNGDSTSGVRPGYIIQTSCHVPRVSFFVYGNMRLWSVTHSSKLHERAKMDYNYRLKRRHDTGAEKWADNHSAEFFLHNRHAPKWPVVKRETVYQNRAKNLRTF